MKTLTPSSSGTDLDGLRELYPERDAKVIDLDAERRTRRGLSDEEIEELLRQFLGDASYRDTSDRLGYRSGPEEEASASLLVVGSKGPHPWSSGTGPVIPK